MPNRLSGETSPYLLQHADNPVDWYPWSDEPFALARETGKPVLLSIGYSACHWCHVMAHESFEDDTTAEVMNSLFVNIKVDREERPDIDRIYQTAHQLLTQRPGGWPLTMFISPENQRPFFGGTYFPNVASHGMPAFTDLLRHVENFFKDNSDDVRAQGEQLMDILARLDPQPADSDPVLDDEPLHKAIQQISENFDREYGGIGSAPKFPHAATLDRLLRHWRSTASNTEQELDSLELVTLTLTRMAEGGIYDHLGGGFCRYSVDQFWRIPHFDKMLYDNGPLLALYAQAFLATGEQAFADVANETANWMLDDMLSPDGSFYSTRDADSEGEEGRYYVWTPDEVRELVGAESFAPLCRHFGLDQAANFEGKWHLSVRQSIADIAANMGESSETIGMRIDAARNTLLNTRSKRVAPGRDEKQLVAWNALAIRGFAIAGLALERADLVDAAAQAVNFIHREMYVDGRLRAAFKDGQARFPAYLDDYAFLLDAVLELLQARWSSEQLEFAIAIADTLLAHFEDADNGGFWFTADDHESLMQRPKPLTDEALPSGNGIAALALQRLGFLLGEARYLGAAERCLRFAWQQMQEYPQAHVSLLSALEEYHSQVEVIVIRGEESQIDQWRNSATKLYSPGRMIFAISSAAKDLPGALAERQSVDGETIAYRCLGTHCEMPVRSWEALAELLVEVRN